MPQLEPSSQTDMTSHSFQLLSDQEIIDMKRSRGIVCFFDGPVFGLTHQIPQMACAECQRYALPPTPKSIHQP